MVDQAPPHFALGLSLIHILRRARELAEEEGPQDHWLLTNHLDYESRLFLCAAVAYSLRCMKRDPYKCAVFVRSVAESLTAGRPSV